MAGKEYHILVPITGTAIVRVMANNPLGAWDCAKGE